MARRILYIQYADPAAYPPIAHSSEILAERGWEVVVLGTLAFGDQGLKLSSDPRIRVHNLPPARTALAQRLQYIRFFFRSLYWTWTWFPSWIYASDPLALPALWLLSKLTKAKILYHEHDSPNPEDMTSTFSKIIWGCRRRVGRQVQLCVLPQQERLGDFVRMTMRDAPTNCVWNCPRQREIRTEVAVKEDDKLILYYHGSINAARVPPELIIATSRFLGAARIRIAGYETAGAAGYVDRLKALASEYGTPGIVEYLGAIPLRDDLLACASNADVGLAFMPEASSDINLRHMVGASNKPFDFMSQGVPLLVSNLPDWISTFVKTGFGRGCDPHSADSIEAELRWYLEHPSERSEMGRRCKEQIRRSWNYEVLFDEVLSVLEDKGREATTASAGSTQIGPGS